MENYHNLLTSKDSRHGSFRKVKLLLCGLVLAFLMLITNLQAQSITSASISNGSSDELTVNFSESITVSNAAGFRLTGGAARIVSLQGGSGTSQLTFNLSDDVLPDDDFELLHWAELSDAAGSSGKLPTIESVSVSNNATAYNGSGTIYYVSDSDGSDGDNGLTKANAFKTIAKAETVAGAGDYILLKRGDTFNTQVTVETSGTSGNYLTYGAYNSGSKPIIDYSTNASFVIANKDYIVVNNLNLKCRKNGEPGAGVRLENGSDNVIISDCLIEGYNGASFGVHLQKNGGTGSGLATDFANPMVLNNYITGFKTNIRFSGYQYTDTYEIDGGLVENNTLRNSTDDDGANFQRGYFNDMIVRKNDVAEYDDDGIDTYGAHDIIIEYNTIHDPQSSSTRGKGIKAGGTIKSSESGTHSGTQSSGIVVRYNIVEDLYSSAGCACDGIVTNGGGSGEIYGNLIYDVDGTGIKIDGQPQDWDIYHNTVIDAQNGIQFYVDSGNGGVINISNNILDGRSFDLHFRYLVSISASGGNNMLLNDSPPSHGSYSGTGDSQESATSLFQNYGGGDFRLKSTADAVDGGNDDFLSYSKDIRGFSISDDPDVGAYEYGDSYAVGNSAPVANAGPNQTVIDSNDNGSEQVTLNGTGSSDSDGTISSYVWKEGGTQIATGSSPTVTLSVGVHTITLTVTDNDSATDTDEVTITVNEPGGSSDVWLEAECADAIGNIWEELSDSEASEDSYLKVKPGNWSAGSAPGSTGQVSFDFNVSEADDYKIFTRVKSLDGSDDSYWIKVNSGSWAQKTIDSDVDEFVWEQVDGGPFALTSGTNTITIGYREPNTRFDKLYLTIDGSAPGGEGSSASNCGNADPVANAGSDQTVTDANDNGSEQVTLNGTGSSDSDGTIASYVWKEGATQIATGATPNVTLSVGVHTITLTVTDDDSATDTDEVVITVQEPTTDVWLEAECADAIGNIWEELSDSEASEDSYLKVKPGNWSAGSAPGSTGQISFDFTVSEADDYKIFTRVKSLDGSDDSYWIKINSGSWAQKTIDSDVDAFVWEQVSGGPFALTSGTNTITIGYREPNTEFDKLYITIDGSTPSGEGSSASNCGGSRRGLLDTEVAEVEVPFRVYPNPVQDVLTVDFFSSVSQSSDIRIMDLSGREMYRTKQVLSEGNNNINLNVNSVPEGVYLLQIGMKERSYSQQIIIK